MAEMKGIKLCGECGNYDWKRHKCKMGCNDDSDAQASFYVDCPLPDVVPKSEVERLTKALDEYEETSGLKQAKAEVAKQIFEEVERMCIDTFDNFNYRVFVKLKKKYTEEIDGSKQ